MTKEEIVTELEQQGLKDILELIRDAEKGYLEELELVEQIGLVNDSKLNQEVINLLQDLNVEIIYVTYDTEEEK